VTGKESGVVSELETRGLKERKRKKYRKKGMNEETNKNENMCIKKVTGTLFLCETMNTLRHNINWTSSANNS
jgi:hypothetical protein